MYFLHSGIWINFFNVLLSPGLDSLQAIRVCFWDESPGLSVVVATSKYPTLLVKYLVTHLSELEIWLREWRFRSMSGRVQP